ELAPAGRAAQQHAVADVDPAEPGAQRHPVDVRLERGDHGGQPRWGTDVGFCLVARHLTLVQAPAVPGPEVLDVVEPAVRGCLDGGPPSWRVTSAWPTPWHGCPRAGGTPPLSPPSCAAPWTPSPTRCAPSTPCSSAARRPTPRCWSGRARPAPPS